MTIIREVERMIERDAVAKRGLQRGLINVRALARQVHGSLRTPTSLDAVISAIRRYPVEPEKKGHNPARLLKNCKIGMKNKIADITLSNTFDIQKSISEISSTINPSRGDVFRFVAGVATLKIIIDERNLDRALQILPRKEVLRITRSHAEIIISLPEEATNTPGIVAVIATELALNNVNLIEIMSCVPELILLVNERDSLKAYEVVESLTT